MSIATPAQAVAKKSEPKFGKIEYVVSVTTDNSGLSIAKTPEMLKSALMERFRDVPANINTAADEKLAQRACGECRSCRAAVEKRRKELKEAAIDYGRRVDAAAEEWTKVLDEIQKPIEDARMAFKMAEQRKKSEEEQRQKEAERLRQEELAAKARKEAEEKLAVERAARQAAEAEAAKQRSELERLRAEAERQRAELAALKAKAAQPSNELLTPAELLARNVPPDASEKEPHDFAPPLAEQLGPAVYTAYTPTVDQEVAIPTDGEMLQSLAATLIEQISKCEESLKSEPAKVLTKKLAKSVKLFEAAIKTIAN